MSALSYTDPIFWESKLGLLPIKLFHSRDTTTAQHKFIMLNGSSNNFCLDTDTDSNNELSESDYWNNAWSCDVGSFIKITNDKVKIFNWGGIKKTEEYSKNVVFDRIDSFYKYLGEKQIPKENAIVPFATSIFRSLRNHFGEAKSAESSLKAFLYMLAFIENDEKDLDLESWGLSGIDTKILGSIEPYIMDLRNGMGYYDLKPNMSLILRHVSGKLFQEAHYLATLDGQKTIWGTASSRIEIQPEKYGTVHFTPSFVARSIVEEVLDAFPELPLRLKIFDPAMGSGEFLKEVLRQLKNKGYNGEITVIGWDISKPAIDMAKFVLAFESKEWDNHIHINLKVVENSLSENWDNDFDIILMNPPFLSWELLADEERNIVKETLENNYQRNPNMASAFFWKATKALKPDGVLGCVMPTSILNADSYKALRQSVEDIITPRLIAKLGNYVFKNALTDACFYVGQKNRQVKQTKVVWTYNAINAAADALRASRKIRFSKSTIINEDNYSVYYANAPHENWTPISYEGVVRITELEKGLSNKKLKPIHSIFEVRQGLNTGNDCFIISKEYYNKLKIDERLFFRPAVQSKAISNGKLQVLNYCFYPSTVGLPPINKEDDLLALVPHFYETVLIHNKEKLLKRARKGEKNWWVLSDDRAWQRSLNPKLVSAAFGSAGSFAFDKTGNFVVERGYGFLPKNEDEFSKDTYLAYLSVFCSSFFDELLGIYSKQIASRWYLAKQFLDNIPIPDFTAEQLFTSSEFSTLSRLGKNLSDGSPIDKPLLNKTVKIIYGIL